MKFNINIIMQSINNSRIIKGDPILYRPIYAYEREGEKWEKKQKGIDRWTPLKNPGIIHESRYGSVPALPQKKSLLSGG